MILILNFINIAALLLRARLLSLIQSKPSSGAVHGPSQLYGAEFVLAYATPALMSRTNVARGSVGQVSHSHKPNKSGQSIKLRSSRFHMHGLCVPQRAPLDFFTCVAV